MVGAVGTIDGSVGVIGVGLVRAWRGIESLEFDWVRHC